MGYIGDYIILAVFWLAVLCLTSWVSLVLNGISVLKVQACGGVQKTAKCTYIYI